MKIKEAVLCLECDELYLPSSYGCPACSNTQYWCLDKLINGEPSFLPATASFLLIDKDKGVSLMRGNPDKVLIFFYLSQEIPAGLEHYQFGRRGGGDEDKKKG